MTPEQHALLQDYVDSLKNLLALKDWSIEAAKGYSKDAGEYAHIDILEARRCATMYVDPGFWQESLEENRHTIAHEIFHCHMQNAADVVRVDMCASKCMPQSEYDVISKAFHRQLEYVVDAITDGVAPLLPLPTWRE